MNIVARVAGARLSGPNRHRAKGNTDEADVSVGGVQSVQARFRDMMFPFAQQQRHDEQAAGSQGYGGEESRLEQDRELSLRHYIEQQRRARPGKRQSD